MRCVTVMNTRRISHTGPAIKLFICCHKEENTQFYPLLTPIQAGARYHQEKWDGYLQDSIGDNISDRNHSYCELTTLYWIWKNVKADYYGLFHYRRFLYPDVLTKKAYRIEKEPVMPLLNKLGYEHFSELIQQYDLIVPIGEKRYETVYSHYKSAPYHHIDDLERVGIIIKSQCPEYEKAWGRYISGTTHYFGNIAIFSKSTLNDYCEWLFSILDEFDNQTDVSAYGSREMRVDGYLGERLLGVYYIKNREKLKTLELPRVIFCPGKDYYGKKAVSLVLPPGSRRRAVVKRAAKLLLNGQ